MHTDRDTPRPPLLNPFDARALVARMTGRSVLVIGDLMLDHFLFGGVERISPEAPVPIVRFDHEQFRPGGAANVACNIQALGGRARVVGLVGADAAGERLVKELSDRGVNTDGVVVDCTRCTTRKMRVVTSRNQQVARIDYEADAELSSESERALADAIAAAAANVQTIVISDYLKGAITRAVVARAREAAAAAGIPLLVDPKVPHIDLYAGATLITPNHHEAEAVTLSRARGTEGARQAAVAFRARSGCRNVLITRGEHGMWLLEAGEKGDIEHDIPATTREVSDVSGAGDTVIGTIALALAAGATLPQAAWLANQAAGLVVAKFGPATVSPQELLGAIGPG